MNNRASSLLVGIGALVAAAVIPVACAGLSVVPAPAPMAEVESSAAGACAGAQFGVLANPNLEIRAIQPGSAAAAAGLKLGDQLVSFEGLSFGTEGDVIRAFLTNEHLSPPCHDTESIPLKPTAVPTAVTPVEGAAGVDAGQVIPTATPTPTTEPTVDFHRPIVIVRDGVEQSIDLDLSIQSDYAVDGSLPLPPEAVGEDWFYF